MFIVLFDPYGNIYDAECIGVKRTRRAALRLMHSLVVKDCKEYDEYESIECGKYIKSLKELIESNGNSDYMFSPRGVDGCYRVMEVPSLYKRKER